MPRNNEWIKTAIGYINQFVAFYSPGTIGGGVPGSTIIFINNGNSKAIINGQPLFPTQPLTIEGYPGQIDETTYTITFEAIGDPADQTNFLMCIRKTY